MQHCISIAALHQHCSILLVEFNMSVNYMSIVYIQISKTYLPEFLNILLYIEANPV